jgi:RNA polymerase sigma-70 factor (ECF subfamily)
MTADRIERLYAEYRDRVFSYINARVNEREDAEDLCSDVFEKVLRFADSFDETKASFGTWLYSITRNTVTDYYRRARPSYEIPEDLASDGSPEDDVLEAQALEELASALERLPADLADVIVYHYYDRMPLTEISEKLGVSYGSVKLKHNKALALLKEAL